MAAGRGEFFRSLLEGLERKSAQPGPGRGQPGPGRGQPGPGRGQPGPGRGQPGPGERQRGRRRRKRPLRGAPSSVGGNERSRSELRTERQKTSSSKENFIERLPSEILIKILSYLDSPSLFCISLVSKLFHRLSSDDVMWHKIYNAEFGRQVWKPKGWDDAALKVDPAEDPSAGHWKKLYFKTVAGQEMSKWRRELKDISPYTGLPKHTEQVLRSLNVSWELTVCDCLGHEKKMEQSRAYFFKSSAIICWSNGSFPKYHHISNIQLHGVRKEPKGPEVRRPAWRSLILKLDMKTHSGWFFGKDKLIKLMHLPPGFIVGIWRGQSNVAFIMVSLHLHKLVEKSLLGSPVCPYSEPADLSPVDDSDPEFGLHGYTLHFILHNTGSEIMSGHFCKLSCHTVQIQRGWVELRVISRTNLSQHRSLSGNITMPWKSDAMEGSVEFRFGSDPFFSALTVLPQNCCIVSLTLLDEIQKPFWCVSSPIRVTMVKKAPSSDYSGEHFAMDFQNPEGQVKMSLVWLKEQKQFFLISLIIYVPVFKVNKHFSTEY
ncbi:F-box only protein 15 [Nibea albiflora]|uniref:F-box only protein 15 n=1 Tax=Nibea albiflora TaxID=240163 RepID=A0ACB7ETV3_NIBAL|nr:F-box only protein 15 [Nibea albiflora]